MSELHSLRGRVAGQSAMSRVLELAERADAPGLIARIFGVSPVRGTGNDLYREALGELVVGGVLDGLGPAWDVIHAVPVGGGATAADGYEIDHLVIGPAGIFAIATRNFSGQDVIVDHDHLLVNGYSTDVLRLVEAQAKAAAEILSAAAGQAVEVGSILVAVGARRFRVRTHPSSVIALQARSLARCLARGTRVDGPTVAYLSDVADRPSTWSAPVGRAEDVSELHRRFARLRARVNSARRTRIIWFALAGLSLGIALDLMIVQAAASILVS